MKKEKQMIKTIMICPVCGKEFYSKYYEGGYIDHVSNWCDLLDKWRLSGKIRPRDILKINIFERLQLANFWGIKTNIFKVTKDLIKSATNRERKF